MLFCESLEVMSELLRLELAGSRPCVLLPLAGGSPDPRCACLCTGQEEGLLQCLQAELPALPRPQKGLDLT